MKRLILTIFISFFIYFIGNSQPCLPEGIFLANQSDIDDFEINYPNCTEIGGNVFVQGFDITNLNGLTNIQSISGSLTFLYNHKLSSLIGLTNLKNIGGNLKIDSNSELTSLSGIDSLNYVGNDIEIYSNPLESLSGLESIKVANGDLSIMSNQNLDNLSGLNNLERVNGSLNLKSNYSLTDITALLNLESIGESLNILSNSGLTSLDGLDNLDTIHGNLMIQANNNLINLSGLTNVVSIDGDLGISICPVLENITHLLNLKSINGELIIATNPILTSLDGLDSIDATTISKLVLQNNNSLSDCSVKSICNYLYASTGDAAIQNNETGCNSHVEVENVCSTSTSELTYDNNIEIYPNPANHQINISNRINDMLVIYDLAGQKILETILVNENVVISEIPEGMYICEISSKKRISRKKILIRH